MRYREGTQARGDGSTAQLVEGPVYGLVNILHVALPAVASDLAWLCLTVLKHLNSYEPMPFLQMMS